MCNAGCLECPMDAPKEILYEVHITVDNFEKIEPACSELGLKPILIVFDDAPRQGMISKTFKASNVEQARLESITLAGQLIMRGHSVQRVKIETVPWNPIADEPHYKSYFEAHFKVEAYIERDTLKAFAKLAGLHFSKNLLSTKNGNYQMVTYRAENGEKREAFDKTCSLIQTVISGMGYRIENVIKEYAFFDTNQALDDVWLKK